MSPPLLTIAWQRLCRSIALAALAGCFSLGGCRIAAPTITDSGLLGLELVPADRGYYRDVHVEHAVDKVVIHGYVKRFIEPGHVRVQLLATDATVMAEDRVEVGRPLRSSRIRHAAFAARLPIPSSPASVRIIHDRSVPETRRK